LGGFIAAMIFLSLPAADECDDLRDAEPRIASCSRSINSGKWQGHDQAVNYFNRGNAYHDEGDNDRAIADYARAISIDPKFAIPHYNRGLIYHLNGDYDRAIADYTQAIGIDPRYADSYNNRGSAYDKKGDYDRSNADYTQAISIDPNYVAAYLNRGQLNLYSGALSKALVDFNKAMALNPKSGYAALWLDIVGQRNNVQSRLMQTSSQVDMTKWPAPVIRLFLGQMTTAAVLTAADDPDANKKKDQVCQANFYSGELSLMKGSKDDAARLFRLAASDCVHDSREWGAANAELKALGAAP
jgi:lipoprotein NlpI